MFKFASAFAFLVSAALLAASTYKMWIFDLHTPLGYSSSNTFLVPAWTLVVVLSVSVCSLPRLTKGKNGEQKTLPAPAPSTVKRSDELKRQAREVVLAGKAWEKQLRRMAETKVFDSKGGGTSGLAAQRVSSPAARIQLAHCSKELTALGAEVGDMIAVWEEEAKSAFSREVVACWCGGGSEPFPLPEELEESLHEMERELKVSQEEMQRLREEVQEARSEADRAKLAVAEALVKQMDAEHEAERAEMELQQSKMEGVDLRGELEKARRGGREEEGEREVLRAALAAAEERVLELEETARAAAIDSVGAGLRSWEEEMTRLVGRDEADEAAQAKLQEAMARAEAEAEGRRAAEAEAEAEGRRRGTLERRVEALEAEKKAGEEVMAEARAAAAAWESALGRAQREAEEAQEELRASSREREAREREMEQRERRCAGAEAEVEILRGQLEAGREALAEALFAAAERAQAEEELERERVRRGAAEAERRAADGRVEELEGALRRAGGRGGAEAEAEREEQRRRAGEAERRVAELEWALSEAVESGGRREAEWASWTEAALVAAKQRAVGEEVGAGKGLRTERESFKDGIRELLHLEEARGVAAEEEEMRELAIETSEAEAAIVWHPAGEAGQSRAVGSELHGEMQVVAATN